MSFLDAREHGSKVGSGGPASAQNEVFAARRAACACMSASLVPASPPLLSCTMGALHLFITCQVDLGNALHLQAIDRRERLRRLALETIDLSKDPYFMRNHLGQYECRLCLTLHNNEGNYLAHTQVRASGRVPHAAGAPHICRLPAAVLHGPTLHHGHIPPAGIGAAQLHMLQRTHEAHHA